VVGGEHEVTAERDRRLAERLPNAVFRLIDNAGHYVPLEAPDALTAIVTEAMTVGA
jgi:pimeloyl-ACP methyl ester carboxylesterase